MNDDEVKMKKQYIKKEDLARVKELDLLTYFKMYAPQELIRNGRNDYITRTHGSLHISNGLWCWWAKGIGGRNALKYLIEVEGRGFLEAALYLKNLLDHQPPEEIQPVCKSIYKFRLPRANLTNDIVKKYLINERKIDKEVVDYCINHYLMYEAAQDHSIVFIGFDHEQRAKFACIRSTNSDKKKDLPGSNKQYSFRIQNKESTILHVFEAPIDLLSYLTLEKQRHRKFGKDNYLSINGASIIGKSIEDTSLPIALSDILKNNEIHSIHLHLDNDKAGKNTTDKIIYHLKDQYEIFDEKVDGYKDVNEYLIKKCSKDKAEYVK